MEKRKLKGLLCLILGAAVMFAGCSSGDDDDDGKSGVNYDAPGTAALPEVTGTSVIRNKVVNLNGSTDVYYEYLTFTSETGGSYSVYKDIDGTKTKIDKIPGTDYALPAEFEYDKSTGKFSAGESTAYMLNVKKGGKDVCAVASEILTTTAENKNTLFNKWKSKKNEGIIFYSTGDVTFIDSDGNAGNFSYTNEGGWILIDDKLPLYWANQTDSYSLYYKIYETERETVEEAGRSAVSFSVFELTSDRFMLIN